MKLRWSLEDAFVDAFSDAYAMFVSVFFDTSDEFREFFLSERRTEDTFPELPYLHKQNRRYRIQIFSSFIPPDIIIHFE